MEEYDIETELSCPSCGHSPLHSRECTNWCEEGMMDESEDDSINYFPGEAVYPCPECKGTGIERWCPKCGKNLSGYNFQDDEQ